MYTIKMCDDKTLLTTYTQPIYQGENNGNTIDFFIPLTYENRDLTDATIRLDYILPNGLSGFQVLTKDEEEYNGYALYHFIITSEFTKLYGKVQFWLTIMETTNSIIIKTSQQNFAVIETINFDVESSIVDQIEAQIQTLEDTKADNLSFTSDQKLQLTANGELIGDEVALNTVINLDE